MAKIITKNRKARLQYDITDTIEAGIVLLGTEIKSLREGKGSIDESYARDKEGELVLVNSHIPHIKNLVIIIMILKETGNYYSTNEKLINS